MVSLADRKRPSNDRQNTLTDLEVAHSSPFAEEGGNKFEQLLLALFPTFHVA